MTSVSFAVLARIEAMRRRARVLKTLFWLSLTAVLLVPIFLIALMP